MEGRMSVEFCPEKELSVSDTWSKREERRKMTLRMGENETEIDFALKKKEHRQVIQTVNISLGSFNMP